MLHIIIAIAIIDVRRRIVKPSVYNTASGRDFGREIRAIRELYVLTETCFSLLMNY